MKPAMKSSHINVNALLETAKAAALEAGKAILEIYHAPGSIDNIQPGEFPVTKADQLSHQILTDRLRETGLPVLSEEGRRTDYEERKQWHYFWLIDPLDGTKEFIKKNDEFTIGIALIKRHLPAAGVIYAPCFDALYYGSEEGGAYKDDKGKTVRLAPLPKRKTWNDLLRRQGLTIVVSRSHRSDETEKFIGRFKNAKIILKGSSLKFLLLIEQEADLYPRLAPTMEWDTAAAQTILNVLNRGVYQTNLQSELLYNKADLTNPSFLAF